MIASETTDFLQSANEMVRTAGGIDMVEMVDAIDKLPSPSRCSGLARMHKLPAGGRG